MYPQKEPSFFEKRTNMNKFVLKVLWLEQSVGISLDQRAGNTTHPLTEYFFWPRKDAWEELKTQFDTNSWIPADEAIVILNQTTDIITCWQEEGKQYSVKKIQEKFPQCMFFGHD
jgi:30S ribosomal protein 3